MEILTTVKVQFEPAKLDALEPSDVGQTVDLVVDEELCEATVFAVNGYYHNGEWKLVVLKYEDTYLGLRKTPLGHWYAEETGVTM